MTHVALGQVRSIERLVMSGPVAAAHADIESTCGSCHVAFSRERQNSLCLDCHEDVGRDIAADGSAFSTCQRVM